MTRGRRRNRVTLSGPANGRKTDEVEISGSDTVLIDDLAVRGFITYEQSKAARTLISDKTKMNDRYEAALERVSEAKRSHIIALLDKETPLAVYGRKVMGYRNVSQAESWAVGVLKASLSELADIYRGKRGPSPFPAYGTPERLDDDGDEE